MLSIVSVTIPNPTSRRTFLLTGEALALPLLLATARPRKAPKRSRKVRRPFRKQDDDDQTPTQNKPTIVLVHGAFADSSSWNGVVTELLAGGFPVVAAANPLRSVKGDAAYVASIVKVFGPGRARWTLIRR